MNTGRLLVGGFILVNVVFFVVGVGVVLFSVSADPMRLVPRILADLDIPTPLLVVAVGASLGTLLFPVGLGVWLLVTGVTD